MIQIVEKELCTGCAACSQKCPKKCISMVPDKEGFLYPVVEKSSCINCGMCEKVCPVKKIHAVQKNELPNSYLVYDKDTQRRIDSAAGGAFTGLAYYFIRKLNGVVFGAAYAEDFSVYHTYAETEDELHRFQKSKYVQSDIKDCYEKVKDFLDTGRYVLFSGTACQVYGLKSYLGKEYAKLYCVDLICYGVPSPKVFSKYLEYMSSKYGAIKNVIVRDKQLKRNRYQMGYGIEFNSGYKYFSKHSVDPMARIFYGKIASRPVCYECPYKTLWRVSDLTVGDCWYGSEFIPGFTDKYGITLVICQSDKGSRLLLECADLVKYEVPTEDIAKVNGGMLYSSCEKPRKREEFFDKLDKYDFSELADYFYPVQKESKKSIIRSFLSDSGLLPGFINHLYRKKKVEKMIRSRSIPEEAKGLTEL